MMFQVSMRAVLDTVADLHVLADMLLLVHVWLMLWVHAAQSLQFNQC